MAGTLFSLALSQQLNSQGKPLLDAPLYVYAANSSTPADTYEDFGLTILNPWPLRTDGAGRFPPFWVNDGAYRARFTDKAGAVVYFDIPYVQALGPSVSEGGGGGGGSVDATSIFRTGMPLWIPVTGIMAGWVRANGRTIGSATSGATERANADTQPLYEYLWNNFSNALCPVSGGRGGSAASDYVANKTIATYSMRGRGPVGLDDMGNTAAGVLVDGTPNAVSAGGNEKLTLPRSALPNATLSVTGSTNTTGAHNHTYSQRPTGGTGGSGGQLGSAVTANTSTNGDHSHTVTGTTTSINGNVTQTAVNLMDPYMLGTFFIKL